MRTTLVLTAVFVVFTALAEVLILKMAHQHNNRHNDSTKPEVIKSDEQWRDELTDLQYRVTRKKATEPPFSGEYHKHRKQGTYTCVACGNPLFSSDSKFDSGTGWPSYCKPIRKNAVVEQPDDSWIRTRTEVICARCHAHLGHVFEDGPKPTGLRYCINSAALDFVPKKPDNTD